MNFKDLIDAVHDLKRTVETDGEGWVPANHTIEITEAEWNDALSDPYLLTSLPAQAKEDLLNYKILGVPIVISGA